MHELARHAIHSTEALAVTARAIKSMEEDLIALLHGKIHLHVVPEMRLLASLFGSLKDRAEANEKRLQNEITLV